ncbi:hypothetical protein FNV43_RR04729 [Rhamnella rubrinervis]|uniref:Bifunctional inhibitor/plant lipid transfer protein/seed storage helical domain-containing protein n=1 Tax=Rhamnella rubrinervis TaxID=2594499 RepID=A0A8K0MQ17_9ROSA|nr:hypothetical protein FNV43_RR04729 [Rhamnella rubrinervis]
MAISSSSGPLSGTVPRLGLAMLVVAGILALISSNSSYQVMAAQDCKNKSALGSLVSQCSNYVKKSGPKVKPLPPCCKAVKAVDVQCVCDLVTKEVEEYIDMNKVVYVARTCGKTIKSGTKCGSYTVHEDTN